MFPTANLIGSETFHSGDNFDSFFSNWLANQTSCTDELFQHVSRHVNQEDESSLTELVERVMANYNNYFRSKATLAREKVFLVLSPSWFSPFERSFLWIGGIKPMHLFELLTNSVVDLSDEQATRVDQMMAEVKEQEADLSNEVVKVEGRLVNPLVAEAARNAVDGQVFCMDVLVDRLKAAMVDLVECADTFRGKVVMQIMEILTPVQKARFLAAFAHFDKTMRTYGEQDKVQSGSG